MSVFHDNALIGASGAGVAPTGYTIDRSLRFNKDDSAYLSRNFGTFTDVNVGTVSFWFKNSSVGTSKVCAAGWSGSTSYSGSIQFSSDNLFVGIGGAAEYGFKTNAVFRDLSAWFHVVVAWDRSETAADKVKVWINGVAQTSSNTGYQSWTSGDCQIWASNSGNRIGRGDNDRYGNYLDGYLAEYHYVDGQALTPSDFGSLDDQNIWQPIQYTGTYGNNGFHLDFSDNSSAAALGYDAVGSNDWTVNNITASAEYYVERTTASTYAGGAAVFGNTKDNIFDGSNSTGTYLNTSNAYIQFEPLTPISFTTSVEVYTGSNGDQCQVDLGSGYGSATAVTRNVWTSVATGPGTLHGLRHGDTSAAPQLNAIRIDGTILSGNTPASDIDSLVDVPTNGTETDTGVGGEVRGNYCTLNPLQNIANDAFSDGNLKVVTSSSNYGTFTSTMATPASGKWYAEVSVISQTGFCMLGLCSPYGSFTATKQIYNHESVAYYAYDGSRWIDGSTAAYGATYTGGDLIGIAYDADGGTVTFYKNGVSQGVITSVPIREYCFAGSDLNGGGSDTHVWNFGQRAFAYTAPSGYKALCTTNLPDPTIADGSTAMDVKLYTGNGSTQSITGYNMSPDLVWVKSRSATTGHRLFDTVRGDYKLLESNSTTAEVTNTNQIAITSSGFDTGNSINTNANNATYVGWAWDAGTSTVTNTDGSITSQVRANASAGFSIVSYTGSSSGTSVGHGLNAAPEMIIVKDRDSGTFNWQVNHIGLGADESLLLNTTAAAADFNAWNNTRPTSSVFYLGAGTLGVNKNGDDHIAYCFAPVEGYSAFGEYAGNSSTDGPFIYTNFRPAFLILKRYDTTGDWIMLDSTRDTFNAAEKYLYPSSNASESTYDIVDFLSNGFKLRYPGGFANQTGNEYIYAAFAENPFKTARAR